MNIGPTAQGGIDPFQEALLGKIGEWIDVYGEAIYKGKPYPAKGMAKNFILKGDDCLYLFFFDVGKQGDENVVVESLGNYTGGYSFCNVQDKVESVKWMDNDEELLFTQTNDNLLAVNITGFPYGINMCVRVAKAKLAK